MQLALDYESKLASIDLCLLGVGGDGHTCSLFHNHPLLSSEKKVDFLLDSPKPPSGRITLTLKALKTAHYCVFVCMGKDKADMIHSVFKLNLKYPCTLVKPDSGNLLWLIDYEAASKLNKFS